MPLIDKLIVEDLLMPTLASLNVPDPETFTTSLVRICDNTRETLRFSPVIMLLPSYTFVTPVTPRSLADSFNGLIVTEPITLRFVKFCPVLLTLDAVKL